VRVEGHCPAGCAGVACSWVERRLVGCCLLLLLLVRRGWSWWERDGGGGWWSGTLLGPEGTGLVAGFFGSLVPIAGVVGVGVGFVGVIPLSWVWVSVGLWAGGRVRLVVGGGVGGVSVRSLRTA